MPSAHLIQNSFNGGEISPRTSGRSDLPAYRAGSQTLRNLIAVPTGGMTRRPGTRYVGSAASQAAPGRLIEFVASVQDSYIIELGNRTMRFYRGDGTAEGLLNYSTLDFGAGQVNLDAEQLEIEGHGFYHGQKVELTNWSGGGLANNTVYYVVIPQAKRCTGQGAGGVYTTEIDHEMDPEMGPFNVYHDVQNGMHGPDSPLFVATVPANDTFTLEEEKGLGVPFVPGVLATGNMALVPEIDAIVNTFRLSNNPEDLEAGVVGIAAASSGTIGTPDPEVVEIITPWDLDDIWKLEYAQSGDVMIFTCEGHPVMELTRYNTSAFLLRRLDPDDGPYSEISPVGTGIECVITTNKIAPDGDIGLMQVDAAVFQGTDAGGWFRKRHSGQTNALAWVTGRIERVKDHNFLFAQPANDFFDFPAAGTNTITMAGHPFDDNELVCVREGYGALPAELSEMTVYQVAKVDGNTVRLSIPGGAAITYSASSGVDHHMISIYLDSVDNAGVGADHGFVTGEDWLGLWSLGDLPLGLDVGYAYRCVVVDANTLYLTDRDDNPVPVGSVGSGKFWLNGKGGKGPDGYLRWRIDDQGSGLEAGIGADPAVNPNAAWRMPAWSGKLGWPIACAFYEQRLVLGGTTRKPNTYWMSQAGNFGNFSPDERTGKEARPGDNDRTITDASGSTYALTGRGSDLIRFVIPATTLILGTDGAMFEVSASNAREPLTPANQNSETASQEGAAQVRAAAAGRSIIYVGAYQTKILAAAYDGSTDTFRPQSITALADHVLGKSARMVQLAWQSEPWGVLWAVRDDGILWGCTFDSDQAIAAWHRHELGGSTSDNDYGEVESVAVKPSTDGLYQQLWMIVKRRIDGADVRYVEYMNNRFDVGDDQKLAYHVDCGPASHDGAAVTSVSGLDHLEGETVDVWADGAAQEQKIVSGGAISIDEASYVSAGLPFLSQWESLELEAALDQQTTVRGVIKNIPDLYLYFHRTSACAVGRTLETLERLVFRTPAGYMDTPMPAFTGRVDVRAPMVTPDGDALLAAEVEGPGPFHLGALVARLEYGER